MSWVQSGIRGLVRYAGYDLVSRKSNQRELDIASAMRDFVGEPKVIVDAGAHKGQSTRFYHESFPGSEIHAFEPDPDVFKDLTSLMGDERGVTLNNVALGSTPGPHKFYR